MTIHHLASHQVEDQGSMPPTRSRTPSSHPSYCDKWVGHVPSTQPKTKDYSQSNDTTKN
jgi:hypothetical protein